MIGRAGAAEVSTSGANLQLSESPPFNSQNLIGCTDMRCIRTLFDRLNAAVKDDPNTKKEKPPTETKGPESIKSAVERLTGKTDNAKASIGPVKLFIEITHWITEN
ncbi:hypothetical protein HDU83_006946, partial [Entophlyctis luteolus]